MKIQLRNELITPIETLNLEVDAEEIKIESE